MLVALVATPICGVLGVARAWFVERTQLPGALWALLLVAPLTMPPFVTSYAWARLGTPLQGFLGAAGIIAFSYYPIVFLLVAVALRGMDPALEETARSLGLRDAGRSSASSCPSFARRCSAGCCSWSSTPWSSSTRSSALKFQTFTVDIYAQYQLGFSASGAAALSFLSIVLCVVLLFAEARLRGSELHAREPGCPPGRPCATASAGPRGPCSPVRRGRAISVGIPVGTLVYWFTESSQRRLCGRLGEPAVPLAGDAHLGGARRRRPRRRGRASRCPSPILAVR